jgi:glycosyltransferase involved in cell wall biosynthesis
MSSLHVLHVLPFPGVGGTEIATRRMADAVQPFGVRSSVILLRPTDALTSYLEDAGIPVVAAIPRPEPSIRHALRFLRESRSWAGATRGVDLIHCADVSAAYHVAVAGRLAGLPVLTHVRNRCVDLSLRSALFVRGATHFAFVSGDTWSSFPIRVPDNRATVVRDGVALPPDADLANGSEFARDVRLELGLSPGTQIVAMFARVAPQKDYDTLIKAAALLRDPWPDLRFVMVGDFAGLPEHRRHFDHVRHELAQAGVADRFLFTGFRADTRRLMLGADVCVLSTHFEGLPLVVLEAMALGRPCVATAVDGIPEMIDDGESGFLSRPGDPASLANALARALADPTHAARLGRKARETVRERFSEERFAREMFDLYARLHQGRRPRLARSTTKGLSGARHHA